MKAAAKTIEIKETSRWRFDRAKADRVVGFFEEMLVYVEGEKAGQPLRLEDWQKDLFSNAFGWVDKNTGYRRFRKVYLEIPKKNGKTTCAAGLSLYLAFADNEPGAKVYFAAGSQDQANIGYSIAQNMVEEQPQLDESLKAYKKSIWRKGQEGNYVKSLSKSVATKHGLNIHGLVYDELHAAPSKELFDTLEKGVSARRQPMVFMITTAGIAEPGNLGFDWHNYALSVIKGDIKDDRFLPVIYAADKEDDPADPATWFKCNPNLDITGGKSVDYMEDQMTKALTNKSDMITFRRLDLNIWTSETSDEIPVDEFIAAEKQVSEKQLQAVRCTLGMDLSKSRDFTSIVLCFHFPNFLYFVPYFWIPVDRLERRPATQQIKGWIREGHAKGCRGEVIDYDDIYHRIINLHEQYNITDSYYDPWNANQLTTRLESEQGIQLEECRQVPRIMSNLYKNWETMTVQGKIFHDGNPVLGWQLNNLILKQDYNANYQPDKKSSLDTIDGVVAMLISMKSIIEVEEKEPEPRIRKLL